VRASNREFLTSIMPQDLCSSIRSEADERLRLSHCLVGQELDETVLNGWAAVFPSSVTEETSTPGHPDFVVYQHLCMRTRTYL
jgi:hypothetical protein